MNTSCIGTREGDAGSAPRHAEDLIVDEVAAELRVASGAMLDPVLGKPAVAKLEVIRRIRFDERMSAHRVGRVPERVADLLDDGDAHSWFVVNDAKRIFPGESMPADVELRKQARCLRPVLVFERQTPSAEFEKAHATAADHAASRDRDDDRRSRTQISCIECAAVELRCNLTSTTLPRVGAN